MFLKEGVLFGKTMTRLRWSSIPLNALVFGKSKKVNLGHDIESCFEQIFDINGDSTMAGWKRSGTKSLTSGRGGIVTTIGRGKRRVRTDGHIHNNARWLKDDVCLTKIDFLSGALSGWRQTREAVALAEGA
jgi:hypothetical protein